VLAKALFDNAAESPDELAFRKGDILMVLERDMGGVPGWWLCSLHGRQGIVPGNRLRLLQSQNQDSGNGCPGIQGESLYQTPGSQNQTQQGDNLYQAPSYEEQESVYLTPKQVASQIYQAPTVVSSEYLVPTRGILASDTVYQAPALQSDRVYLAPTRSGLGERSAQLSAFQAARQAVANVYVCPTAKHPTGDIYQAPTDPKLAFRNPAGNSPAFQEKSDLGKSSPDNLYQAPTGIKDLGSESFYLAPTGIHQIPNPRQESQILYQTPKSAAPLPKTSHKTGQTSLENVYLAPTNGVVQNQIVGQEAQNMYKSPKMCHKVLGAPKTEIPTSTQEALGKTVGGGNTVKVPHVLKQHVQHKPPVGQTKVCQKVAPISVRDSPKLLRKGGKDGPQIPAAVPSGNSGEADPAPLTGQEEGEWGSLTAPTPAEDSSSCIYNVPRIINGKQIDLLQEAEQEVYDIPSMFVREETYNIPACHGPFKEDSEPAGQEEEVEEDVYSVPSLAGQPSILNPDQRVREVGGMHSVPGQVPEDCGIYDLPAASVAMEEMDLLTEPDFIRRLSISSNGSGQSKSSTESCLEALSALLQSAQCSASGPAPPPRELASLLAEIVSVSRQHGEFGETLSRLSDFIPSLSRGAAPDALLSLVRKALEDSASLLAGHAHRPRLSSQESLSRRPLPALPVAEVTRSPPALPLSSEDRQLLSFYAEQSQAHLVSLNDAIDSLFTSVQGNQPPRAFVSKGKLVIVTAHKLVFIGDTLSRLLASPEVRSKVTTSGAHLCQALKVVVLATKGAALHYPSVSALQEMVNRVAELSQHAVRFASLLPRMANPS
ncbi:Enhancer of filamentation 1, partial [Acipenser ruthenus]